MDFLLELYNEATKIELLIIGFILFIAIVNGFIKIPHWAKLRKKKAPHEGCPYAFDFKSSMEKIMEKTSKISYIKNRLVMKDQMAEVDIITGEIVTILRDNFNELLSKTKLSEEEKIEARKAYKSTIENAVIKEAKHLVRTWIAKNHFTEKTDLQFIDYINEKIRLIYEAVTREVRENYLHKTMKVPQTKLTESVILNCSEKINPKIQHMFSYAREVAEKYEKEIALLEAEE